MIETYKAIPNMGRPPAFSMPLSLRTIKEASENHIDWKSLHIVDLFSILYSIRIDKALQYLNEKKRQSLQERGISEVRRATEEDFDKL